MVLTEKCSDIHYRHSKCILHFGQTMHSQSLKQYRNAALSGGNQKKFHLNPSRHIIHPVIYLPCLLLVSIMRPAIDLSSSVMQRGWYWDWRSGRLAVWFNEARRGCIDSHRGMYSSWEVVIGLLFLHLLLHHLQHILHPSQLKTKWM